nr:hypothetical protein [Aurantiacibacter sp. 219JJ12-13]MDP5263176.1 hypothetical protein [Aurantiacibacter sp. 219JJ12-13]
MPLAIVAASLAACIKPDPADYGGGELGAITAQCVSRLENRASAIDREKAGAICTCMSDTMTSSMANGTSQAAIESALLHCASRNGLALR